jgi:hypothetical protein
MVEVLNLPYRAIESTSCVGPFFWAAWDQDEVTPHLREYILAGSLHNLKRYQRL